MTVRQVIGIKKTRGSSVPHSNYLASCQGHLGVICIDIYFSNDFRNAYTILYYTQGRPQNDLNDLKFILCISCMQASEVW